jgi:hypothetical protein
LPPHDLEHAPQAAHPDIMQSAGQGFVLQVRSVALGHALPPCAAALMTFTRRDWVPVPQVAVHRVHGWNSWAQWTGHAAVLHAWASDTAGQILPLCTAAVTTLRALVCTPPPHASVHADQADQAETPQSTEGSRIVTVRTTRGGDADRPYLLVHAYVTEYVPGTPMRTLLTPMATMRSLITPSTLSAHVAPGSTYSLVASASYVTLALPERVRTGSLGHAPVLHACSPVCAGHALPPNRAAMSAGRVRVRVPPAPHVAEQVPNADQSPTTQSTGQAWALHTRSSSFAGHRACTASARASSAFAAVARLFWRPPPHDFVHADQADHLYTGQSAGLHTWVLQSRDSSAAGQGSAPWAGRRRMFRMRDWMPDPQTSEQTLHVPHSDTAHATGQTLVLHARVSVEDAHATPP